MDRSIIVPPEHRPLNVKNEPHNRTQPKNLFSIVAKINNAENGHIPHSDLVSITEKLAEEAKNGTLKGLGWLAEYDGTYTVGLSGSYDEHPGAAVLPVKRLERKIMDRIVSDEK